MLALLNTPEQIRFLVRTFYTEIRKNAQIGHIFEQLIADWEVHLQKICFFWEAVLLGGQSYQGNPMLKHIEIDKKIPLSESDFEVWLSLWTGTIDAHFEGEKAEEAKQRAQSMGWLMLYKIAQSKNPLFIQ